ncbi:hypothetical protein CP533_4463 [Ophiocordyceps camponoti-saundersi (nom. inval.)]|nr:hypothetical protein CP533_4463 [Ophiocordyceps camponoti-saundersi (nom. inval.)]
MASAVAVAGGFLEALRLSEPQDVEDDAAEDVGDGHGLQQGEAGSGDETEDDVGCEPEGLTEGKHLDYGVCFGPSVDVFDRGEHVKAERRDLLIRANGELKKKGHGQVDGLVLFFVALIRGSKGGIRRIGTGDGDDAAHQDEIRMFQRPRLPSSVCPDTVAPVQGSGVFAGGDGDASFRQDEAADKHADAHLDAGIREVEVQRSPQRQTYGGKATPQYADGAAAAVGLRPEADETSGAVGRHRSGKSVIKVGLVGARSGRINRAMQ